ncbi:hypothetical protein F1559_002637 [Cyanidiococcus yangmingshanensis]|uniref:Uncharacterized protein n=1 Tax=Cyanidiococcus yangmingshanensis TaxID=2690220 RepID=A0A7J7II28_9RHOD|nr:hypothetical protein F1559_002637 [Cyanidiococcus yangmingshanensis]
MSEATARRQRSRRELPEKPSRPGPSATVLPSSAVTKRAPRQNEAPSKLLDMNKMYSVAAGMDATRVPLEASSEATVAPTTSRDLPPGCDVDAYGELAQVLWSNPLDEAVRWVSTGRQWTPETSLEVLTGSRLPGMSTRAASSSSNGGRRRSTSRDISPSSLLESVDAVDGARWSQLYHGLDDPTSTQWAGTAPVTSLSRPETMAAATATASLAPPEAVYGDEKELVGVTSIAEGEDVGRTMDHDMPIHLNQDSGMHRTWDRARSPSRDTSTSMESSPLHQLLSDTGLDSRLDTGSTTSVGLRYYRQSPFARYDSPLRQPVFVEWSTGNTSVMPETNAAWQSLAPDMGTARENSPATRLVTPDIVTWSTERANAAGVDVSNRAAFSRPDEISEQAKIAHQTESKTLELKTESISRSLDEQYCIHNDRAWNPQRTLCFPSSRECRHNSVPQHSTRQLGRKSTHWAILKPLLLMHSISCSD